MTTLHHVLQSAPLALRTIGLIAIDSLDIHAPDQVAVARYRALLRANGPDAIPPPRLRRTLQGRDDEPLQHNRWRVVDGNRKIAALKAEGFLTALCNEVTAPFVTAPGRLT